MRIAVIGAGAMGCLFGGLLAGAAEVVLVDRSPEVVQAICARGVRILEPEGERHVRVAATTSPDAVGPADLALIAVKSYGTSWAAEMAARILAPDGLALTLQNGLGNREVLVERLGTERVWQGVTAQGATLLDRGCVRHAGNGPTELETRSGIEARAAAVADLFNYVGLETHLSPDLVGLIWGKLVVNAGINGLTALLRVPNGALAESGAARRVMAQIVAEAVQVATARGVPLPFADAQERVLEVCRMTAANHSSMLQDVERGRPTEIEAINGAIVREARVLGLLAPANEMLYDLILATEATAALRSNAMEEVKVNKNLAKPTVAITLSDQEVVDLKMIIQDEDEKEALEFLRNLKRKVVEMEQKHCGDPDRLPGLG